MQYGICQVIIEETVPLLVIQIKIYANLSKIFLLKNEIRCRVACGFKKNENKGDVEFTL